jgi:hypothetical protein
VEIRDTMGNVIDIHIHLEKDYPPDPTRVTDYVALGLVGFYALYSFIVNISLAYIASRWKFVQSINIPLVYMMSFFSMCHMICIFLDMSYVGAVTEYVQTVSCVATAYWGEYCLGLCGFMAVLGVRVYSLLMVSVDLLRPKGARYRRTLLKCIFFMLFLLPIYGLCLLVTVDNDAEYSDTLMYCETPNAYKISVVAILIAYMLVLTAMVLWLKNTDINPSQASPILNIVTLSLPLLIISCVIHFGYMLPHYWGRLAFMCTAFVLHLFAYVRITTPVLVEYWRSNRAELNSMQIPDTDNVASKPRAPVAESFYTETTLKMSDDVKWIMSILEGRRCKLSSEVLKRFPEIRKKFFNRCRAGCVDDLATFCGEELREVNYFDDDEESAMPIYRLITFYEDIDAIYTQSKFVYSLSTYHNDQVVGQLVRDKIAVLWKTFLAPHSKAPVNIPVRLAQRIREGFAQSCEWDYDVLMQLMTTILDFLIVLDDGIFSGEFDEIIYEMCERYGEKIDAMDAENIIDLAAEVTDVSATSHFSQLLEVLKAGPGDLHAKRGDLSRACALNLEDDLYGDSFDVHEGSQEVDFGEATPDVTERVVDEHLPDGSIRYKSATRAAAFFVYDVCHAIYAAPASCIADFKSELEPSATFADEVILVDN